MTTAWEKTAGAVGEPKPGELDEVLAGWAEDDPALERAIQCLSTLLFALGENDR